MPRAAAPTVAASAGDLAAMRRSLLFGLLALFAGGAAQAQTPAALTIAVQQEPTAMDPHFHNSAPNNAIARHVFDALVHTDERLQPGPGLAESWRVIDDRTWEFRLRRGVTFHDGTPFTADDVLFTFERVPNVQNSPGSFALFTRGKTLTALDPHTLRITTAQPTPLMLSDIATVAILSRRAAEGATTEQFNAGRATIGTGPFRFTGFTPGDRVELARNDAWWGEKPAWERVTVRLVRANPARVAALLSGQVDMIDHVPTTDIARLRGTQGVQVVQVPSSYVVFLSADSNRDITPFVRDNQGRPMHPNPLRDARVRRALSLAINRDAIVQRIMDGAAVPAGQTVQEGFLGHDPDLRPDPFDPAQARALLAQAGYPEGFQLTLHSPNDRYVNDARIAEAVAQMFTRIGVRTTLETYTRNVFFARATNGGEMGTPEFSLYLTAFASTGEALSLMVATLASHNPAAGLGTNNRGRYSNVRLDARLALAARTVDDAARGRILAEAQRIAMNDVAFIPLHFQANTWALRSNLTMMGRADEQAFAFQVRPKN
jgi:peptide/nickel transport system substrate-binding protein